MHTHYMQKDPHYFGKEQERCEFVSVYNVYTINKNISKKSQQNIYKNHITLHRFSFSKEMKKKLKIRLNKNNIFSLIKTCTSRI